MANRSTTSEYQPIPPYLRVNRLYGGTRTGGNPGRAPAFANANGIGGQVGVKGNIMASGGAPATTPFGGGTARGGMRISNKTND